MKRFALIGIVPTVALTCSLLADGPASVEIQTVQGRPALVIDGKPDPLPAYSPVSARRTALFKKQSARFFPHKLGAYLLEVPSAVGRDFYATPFWSGDKISSEPMGESTLSLDEQAQFIGRGDSNACFIVRFGIHEPQNWRDLHSDQLFVTEEGKRLEVPSLASKLYNDMAARFSVAVVEHCESRPWANRIIGYANFLRTEGTHEPIIHHWLFDHSELMRKRFGKPVPTDKLRGATPSVAQSLYWQADPALREYLLLQRDLFHEHFRGIAAAMRDAISKTGRKRFVVFDALKQAMMGWSNSGFFDEKVPWPLTYAEDRAGSGHIGVAALFDAPGFDGLITPHDYHARGIGGVYEPEGAADSMVLRGKLFFSEMDTRTYAGTDSIAPARDDREFAAITWRNIATSLTRGFHSYWMDVYQDWFATEGMHKVIARQVEVVRESVNWPHETLPGIAMILDDEAVLETNGDGRFFHEAILWETKMGIARCGVPFRIYLLDDLRQANFPKHRVYYFPNLFRVDDARLALLKEKVFRDGNVVVWGPGSGITDGARIGTESATKLTGFEFELLPANYPRRTLIANFDHAITRALGADVILGGPLAYGPCLYPKDGTSLGAAWTKQGRNCRGLAIKKMDGWHSVFTTAVPLPADLWRGLARFAGAHVYCESNDILLADASVVALHSLRSGKKTIRLPEERRVMDLITSKTLANRSRTIDFEIVAPETCVFLLKEPGN